MRFLLFILASLAFLAGACVLVFAKSAIHEIEALILFLIAAVFCSGAGIVDAVVHLRKETGFLMRQANK